MLRLLRSDHRDQAASVALLPLPPAADSGRPTREDTYAVGDAYVTLSTFYDGTRRVTRCAIVAHTGDEEPAVLSSFDLTLQPGPPSQRTASRLHTRHADQIGALLDGRDTDEGDAELIRLAVQTASAYHR